MTLFDEGLNRIIPSWSREEMRSYIKDGVRPGRFLSAILTNDLFQSHGYADDYFRNEHERIDDYIMFLVKFAPPNCFGSHAKVEAWIEDAVERRAMANHAGPQP